MLRSIKSLIGSRISATDDQIGAIDDVFFDDEVWTVRYLVVDTGVWLPGRKVLISPYSIRTPLTQDRTVDVDLTREQVRESPDIDTHQPISRRIEREYLAYYGYPSYWGLGGVWGAMDFPVSPLSEPRDLRAPGAAGAPDVTGDAPVDASGDGVGGADDEDSRLRSAADVKGYDIQAADGSIGHVQDYVFDDETWTVRYIVVDTVNWWPGGRKVLVATAWIDGIDWAARRVTTSLTRDGIKASPEYDEDALLDRQFEARLHASHERAGYWE